MKIPIIFRNSRVPSILSIFINIRAITLFPFIFIKDDGDDDVLINHENIHIRQQKELFVLFFYFIYLFDWIWATLKYRDPKLSYYAIRFEQEANDRQNDLDYLNQRKPHSWLNYKV